MSLQPRLPLILTTLLLLPLIAGPLYAASSIIPRSPHVNATSYLLMDAATGHIIVEQNADEPLPPASLTKIMTAYIAMEEIIRHRNIKLTDMVRISNKAWSLGGSGRSSMFLKEGAQVSMEDLLRGVIVQSGNDASVAIAEYIGGSEEAFADMMNQYADLLGMTGSRFMNASGLDTEVSYNTMSARDLAILARASIVRHAELYPMYAEQEFTYDGVHQKNRNTLLVRDPTVDGLKTGWTSAAGFCLVASAQRGGMRLISVVMGADSEDARVRETQKLFTYGFRFFQTHNLYERNKPIATVPVWSGVDDELRLGVLADAQITLPRGELGNLDTAIEVPEVIYAPIENRQVLGEVTVSLGDEVLYVADVVALAAVERGGLFKRVSDWFTLTFGGGAG